MRKSDHPIRTFPDPDELCDIYGFQTARLRHLARGHGAQILLTESGGEWILKRVRANQSAKDLEILLSGANEIRGAMTPARLPEIRVTRQGSFLHSASGELYYLMKRVEGRRPSFKRIDDVARVLESLARFHLASAQVSPALVEVLQRGPSVDPLPLLREQADHARRVNRRVRNRHPATSTLLGRWAASRNDKPRRLARQALDFYVHPRQGSHPDESAALAACPVLLAHGDTHENNFLIGGDVAWLLDLESCTLRPAVLDLPVPLHYLGQAIAWRSQPMMDLIERYESIRPLGDAERLLLGAQLIHPRLWLRGMHSLFKRGGRFKWTTARMLWRESRAMDGHRKFARLLFERWSLL